VSVLSTFFQNNSPQVTIPEVLIVREQTYTMFLVAVLSLSFLLISVARNINSRSLGTVVSIFFRDSENMEIRLKENMRIGSLSSVILIFNYFISFSLCNFIFFHRILLFDDTSSLWLSFVVPFILFIIEMGGIVFAGLLSGETKRLQLVLLNVLTTSQFSGIFFTLIALFWIMNTGADKLFLSLYLAIVALKEITRVLKSSTSVLANGVSWYYLILYICTLEILPLFVICIYLLKNFMK
jgi:hypothetical protein